MRGLKVGDRVGQKRFSAVSGDEGVVVEARNGYWLVEWRRPYPNKSLHDESDLFLLCDPCCDPANYEAGNASLPGCPAEGDPDEEVVVLRCKKCGGVVARGIVAALNEVLKSK